MLNKNRLIFQKLKHYFILHNFGAYKETLLWKYPGAYLNRMNFVQKITFHWFLKDIIIMSNLTINSVTSLGLWSSVGSSVFIVITWSTFTQGRNKYPTNISGMVLPFSLFVLDLALIEPFLSVSHTSRYTLVPIQVDHSILASRNGLLIIWARFHFFAWRVKSEKEFVKPLVRNRIFSPHQF